jgi:hypothetical protein
LRSQAALAVAGDNARDVLPVIEDIRTAGISSLKGIAAELNSRGILTARGGQWYAATVRNLLARSSGLAGIARARTKGTRSGKALGAPKLSAEREAAVRAALAVGTGIRRTSRLVGTGNATVARIVAEMRQAVGESWELLRLRGAERPLLTTTRQCD